MGFSVDTRIILCYIESHIKEKHIDKEELAKITGFSMAYIREFFKKNTGCSLARYILERKISSSMFELIHTKMTIVDIAFLYGFSSHESYTRAFYRVVRMTPSNFRRKKPIVGKKELTAGIFGIGFLEKKEKRSDISMKGNYDKDHDSTILYNVPNVGFGTYGGCTPFPICLKACLDYLGEEVEYAFSMVATGAAFRMTWNQETWDLSNVDIYHTFESDKSYELGAKAFGREFELLGRNKDTTKEEFKTFIKKHIDEGYPCIALGIIGPPEACLITGYRKQGEILLGWNFFQNDPDFAANVKKEENGYFHCDSWWENTDTQAVMSIGPIKGQGITTEEILKNAVQIMTGRKEYSYCKGLFAYDAWLAMLKDQRHFSVSAEDYSSILFEKLLCQTDAMTCLSDGRGSAADYFTQLSQ